VAPPVPLPPPEATPEIEVDPGDPIFSAQALAR